MKHVYLMPSGSDPIPGAVAQCGFTMVKPANPSDAVCATCLKLHAATRGTSVGAAVVRDAPPRDAFVNPGSTEEVTDGEMLYSIDTSLSSDLITVEDINRVNSAFSEQLEDVAWDDTDWEADPVLNARFTKFAAAMSPDGPWWPLVDEWFEEAVESQDIEEDPADWARTLFADKSEWTYVSGSTYKDFRWDAWNCLSVHEGSAFVLITALDGSTAMFTEYLL